MTPQEFCYWLQGFFEISGATKLTEEQAKVVKEHLQLVFTKVTGGAAKAAQQWPMPIAPRLPQLTIQEPVVHFPPSVYCRTETPSTVVDRSAPVATSC